MLQVHHHSTTSTNGYGAYADFTVGKNEALIMCTTAKKMRIPYSRNVTLGVKSANFLFFVVLKGATQTNLSLLLNANSKSQSMTTACNKEKFRANLHKTRVTMAEIRHWSNKLASKNIRLY